MKLISFADDVLEPKLHYTEKNTSSAVPTLPIPQVPPSLPAQPVLTLPSSLLPPLPPTPPLSPPSLPPSSPLPPPPPAQADQCAYKLQVQQLYQIQERLQSDIIACDARLSLFVAAANSYHYESLLPILPEEFHDGNGYPKIDAIFDVICDLDRLKVVLQHLMLGRVTTYSTNVLKLLHVILVQHGDRVALSTLHRCEFKELFAHLMIEPPQRMPTHIFEVIPSLKDSCGKGYTSLREQYPEFIGYYSGKLENLYMMLTEGSLPLNEPLELCCNMKDALRQSTYCPAWGGSGCGSLLRCVAIVEYVLVPSKVIQSAAKNSVIITDANCMQISYLMFYGKTYKQYERKCRPQLNQVINWDETFKWMDANKYMLSLGVYLMMLPLAMPSGRGILHKLGSMGLYALRKGFFKI